MINLFRRHLREDVVLQPAAPGPVVLGGPKTKHFAVSFKEGGEDYSERSIITLAQMVSDFPNDIQFYLLGDPLRDCIWHVEDDNEVSLRKYYLPMEELWTEPGEDVPLEGFVSKKKWDAHIKVVHELVIMFER